MIGRLTHRHTTATAAGVLLVSSMLGGCGGDAPAGEQVPALGQRLARVDAAVEAGDYAQARTAVEALVNDTAQAKVAGDLSDEQAERVLDAAADVLARLPASTPSPAPSPATTSPSPSTSLPAPSGSSSPGPAKGKGGDKKDKRKEEGKGNGHSK